MLSCCVILLSLIDIFGLNVCSSFIFILGTFNWLILFVFVITSNIKNINTTAVTAEVELVSTTSSRGGANNVANGTSFLIKDVSIPTGSSLEILSGGKVVLEAGDKIQIDCSVADKLSGTLSIMEIT